MILEVALTIILGLILGVIITKKVDSKKNISAKIRDKKENTKISKVINNPELLKQKLEENGEIIDRLGLEDRKQKISFEVIEGQEGKTLSIKKEDIKEDIKSKKIKKKPKAVKKSPSKKTRRSPTSRKRIKR